MSRRRTSGLKFTGELAKPLGFRRTFKRADISTQSTAQPQRTLVIEHAAGAGKTSTVLLHLVKLMNEANERSEKLEHRLALLLRALDIPKGRQKWKLLAIRLAEENIPGFRYVAPPGAPRLWTPSALKSLRDDIDALRSDGLTVIDACRRLVVQKDGTWRYPRSRKPDALRRRYYQALKA